MIFIVNCERCGDLLIRGKIYNYKGKNICEDCNTLLYLFVQKAPDLFMPDVLQLHRRISTPVGLQLLTKR